METLRCFVLENTHLDRRYCKIGWGNGYVVIPKGHPMYGMDYDRIHEEYPGIEVHGGLTYSNKGSAQFGNTSPEDWVIGFDTCHYGDDLTNWPNESRVLDEAKRLAAQCELVSA